jgi:TorA maturation chaperone TorD
MTEVSATDIGGRVEAPLISCDAEASLRSGTYSLLANLLASPPDQGILDLITGIDRSSTEGAETMLGAAWHMLAEAAERANLSALDDEYHALFIGLGRGELIPFGSWYVTGFLMEQPLARLRADLARLGFERQEGVSEPEDHVAGLCDVMAILNTEGEVAAYELQREFFERHMLPWMPRFFRDLQEAKSASFYRAVGQLGEQFLEVEKEFLRASAPASESTRQDGLS